MNTAAQLMSGIKSHIAKSFIMEMLSTSTLQRWFTKSLIERALGRSISDNEHICLDDNTSIKMETVIEYPYFKRAIKKVTVVLIKAECVFFHAPQGLVNALHKKRKTVVTMTIKFQ